MEKRYSIRLAAIKVCEPDTRMGLEQEGLSKSQTKSQLWPKHVEEHEVEMSRLIGSDGLGTPGASRHPAPRTSFDAGYVCTSLCIDGVLKKAQAVRAVVLAPLFSPQLPRPGKPKTAYRTPSCVCRAGSVNLGRILGWFSMCLL